MSYGSGGYALHLAEKVGCRLVGLDINAAGVRNANQLELATGFASRAHFEQCDVSKNLPFDDKTFDAVFSNDVLCHVPGRLEVMGEIFRVLKPGGRMLFSDALVVGGMLSHESPRAPKPTLPNFPHGGHKRDLFATISASIRRHRPTPRPLANRLYILGSRHAQRLRPPNLPQ